MPEITAFGWFHTLVAIVALLAGFYTLARFKVISSEQLSGKIYLIVRLSRRHQRWVSTSTVGLASHTFLRC